MADFLNSSPTVGAVGAGSLSNPWSALLQNIQQNKADIGGGAGALLAKLFGHYQDPMQAANPYLQQISGTSHQYLDPYISQGQGAYGNLSNLSSQYQGLINDPAKTLSDIGSHYTQSPGYQFALKQALGSINNRGAAGGMLGTPQQRQLDMSTATNLANQDYGDYMQKALGLYGQGLSGYGDVNRDIYHTGYNASNDLLSALASQLATQGSMAYQGAQANNKGTSDFWGKIGSMLTDLV